MKLKQVRHPRKKVLEIIAEGFGEIEAHFELEGFSDEADAASENDHAEDGAELEDGTEEDYYGDVDFAGAAVFHREDIEVAIDVLISRLVQDKIIKIDPDNQPSLSELFERFFGEDHEITEAAREFEKNIEGYFGAIGYDAMDTAYGQVSIIRDIIKREMSRNAKN